MLQVVEGTVQEDIVGEDIQGIHVHVHGVQRALSHVHHAYLSHHPSSYSSSVNKVMQQLKIIVI